MSDEGRVSVDDPSGDRSCRVLGVESRVLGVGYRVQGVGCRV